MVRSMGGELKGNFRAAKGFDRWPFFWLVRMANGCRVRGESDDKQWRDFHLSLRQPIPTTLGP